MSGQENMEAIEAPGTEENTEMIPVPDENASDSAATSAGGATANANSNAADEDDRKLFAGGLPQDATEDDIKEYFSKFGEIESINLKTDQNTGRSRGFCFIVYKGVEPVNKATAEANHFMKGKKVAVKKAQAKQGKIYVGKLKPDVTDEDIRDYFAQYGTIAAIEQPFDKMKNERKNFCFITYEREDPAKKLLKMGTVVIKGFELDINKVTPKAPAPPGGMFGGGKGPGGWGGYGGGGNWGAYGGGDYWGGYGGPGGGYDQFGGGYGGGWGGYGGAGPGGWGGYGGGGPGGGGHQHQGGFGGKSPMNRGRGGPRGGGRGQMRQKPY